MGGCARPRAAQSQIVTSQRADLHKRPSIVAFEVWSWPLWRHPPGEVQSGQRLSIGTYQGAAKELSAIGEMGNGRLPLNLREPLSKAVTGKNATVAFPIIPALQVYAWHAEARLLLYKCPTSHKPFVQLGNEGRLSVATLSCLPHGDQHVTSTQDCQ